MFARTQLRRDEGGGEYDFRRQLRHAGEVGVTLSTPEQDRYGYDANCLRGRIIGALGGMVAEDEVSVW